MSLQTQHREASWATPAFALFQKTQAQAAWKHEATDSLNNLGKPVFTGLQAPGPTHVMISQDEPLLKSLIRLSTHLWGFGALSRVLK